MSLKNFWVFWLPSCENLLSLGSAILTQYRGVTDGQTNSIYLACYAVCHTGKTALKGCMTPINILEQIWWTDRLCQMYCCVISWMCWWNGCTESLRHPVQMTLILVRVRCLSWGIRLKVSGSMTPRRCQTWAVFECVYMCPFVSDFIIFPVCKLISMIVISTVT